MFPYLRSDAALLIALREQKQLVQHSAEKATLIAPPLHYRQISIGTTL